MDGLIKMVPSVVSQDVYNKCECDLLLAQV